jgi:ribosomal protein L11 methyltransferase
MPWQQLECNIPSQKVESLTDYLESIDALAITLVDAKDDPIFEPEPGTTPLWQECKLIALFEHDVSLESHLNTIQQLFSCHATISKLADKAWERECMDQFQPIQFGTKLWVCPSWHTVSKNDAVVVMLDPGLAFGTGNHPTTRLCLEWLTTHAIEGKNVIDYGCGSGILAIAAAKLGAANVYAVDIDAQALHATQENAARNHVSQQVQVYLPNDLPSIQADILIANILAAPLISLVERFNQLIRSPGCIVLSGILDNQINEVVKAYQTHFSINEHSTIEDWGLIAGIKQNA